jgi:hypothetical protein
MRKKPEKVSAWLEAVVGSDHKLYARIQCCRCGGRASKPLRARHALSPDCFVEQGWVLFNGSGVQDGMCPRCHAMVGAETPAVQAVRAGAKVIEPVPCIEEADEERVCGCGKPVDGPGATLCFDCYIGQIEGAVTSPTPSFLQSCWDAATDAERDQLIDVVFAWAEQRTRPAIIPPPPPPPAETITDPVLAMWRRMQEGAGST